MGAADRDDVRTRFAPSPSGHLHVGGARTALFNWAYARGRGGRFILRLEDTDVARSSEPAARALLEDLRWLGIDWDEGPEFAGCGGGDSGPYAQSQRLDLYRRHVDALIEAGRAYRAFETREEIEAARAAAGDGAYRYDRAALALAPETVQRYLAEGRPHVVRFRLPDVDGVTVPDAVRGGTHIPAGKLDDFVILKADGYPTYHLAVVVDDELMGVTHVIRGEEHLQNTARHVLLQQALGFRQPVYAHVSLIFNPDGSKMSKREKDRALRRAVTGRGLDEPPAAADGDGPAVEPGTWRRWLAARDSQLPPDAAQRLAAALDVEPPAVDVEDFRAAGYLPEAIVNYLALLGWSPGGDVEKFDAAWFAGHFDLDRIIKSAARFDRDKLLAFNLDALQGLPAADFEQRLRGHGERYHPQFLHRLGARNFPLFAACNQARSKTLEDPYRSCRFLVIDDEEVVYEDSKAARKALEKGEPSGYALLERARPVLAAAAEWSVEALERALGAFAEAEAGGKLGRVAQPLRVAVTGTTVSPAIFETLVLLGRESTLRRIDRLLARRGVEAPGPPPV